MLEKFQVTMKALNRERNVTVYVPAGYFQTGKAYPVLYMQDGQNLFRDEEASFGISWGIEDYLNKSGLEIIVVGIDCNHNGYDRFHEYAPWGNETLGKAMFDADCAIGGEGKLYVDFLVHELKSFIDRTYRTVAEDTAIAGSSMGGLISTYAACVYPEIFKKVASLSSAYWFNQGEIEQFIENSDLSEIQKFYLDVGTKEETSIIGHQDYIDSSIGVYRILKDKVKDCRFEIIADALHNEAAWRERVPQVFAYLFE
ncbi:MAG: alpha/beta hydrolase [Ectobacillus sp.]